MSLLPDWLSENIGDQSRLHKAERNLEQMLDMSVEQDVISMVGPVIDPKTKKTLKKINPNLLKVKQDTSKFIAERLGKHKYSLKHEISGNLTYQPVVELPPIKNEPRDKNNLEAAAGPADRVS